MKRFLSASFLALALGIPAFAQHPILCCDYNGDHVTIVGADGMPNPNPLTPPAQCAATKGCSFLADFQFVAQRVQVAN